MKWLTLSHADMIQKQLLSSSDPKVCLHASSEKFQMGSLNCILIGDPPPRTLKSENILFRFASVRTAERTTTTEQSHSRLQIHQRKCCKCGFWHPPVSILHHPLQTEPSPSNRRHTCVFSGVYGKNFWVSALETSSLICQVPPPSLGHYIPCQQLPSGYDSSRT